MRIRFMLKDKLLKIQIWNLDLVVTYWLNEISSLCLKPNGPNQEIARKEIKKEMGSVSISLCPYLIKKTWWLACLTHKPWYFLDLSGEKINPAHPVLRQSKAGQYVGRIGPFW